MIRPSEPPRQMLTAVATLQLAQAGKLRLDAPIGTYLTGSERDMASKVTLHHLLTHTGGIFGPQFTEHRSQLRTADYLRLSGTRAPAVRAGREACVQQPS